MNLSCIKILLIVLSTLPPFLFTLSGWARCARAAEGAGPAQDPPPRADSRERAELETRAMTRVRDKDHQMAELGRQAHSLAQRGRCAYALTAYARSYVFSPRPTLLFDSARCALVEGRLSEALELYNRYAVESPSGDNIEVARQEIERLVEVLGTKAGPDQRAALIQRHVSRASAFSIERRYEQALEESSQAYLLRRQPKLLFVMAQWYEAWNRPAEAYLLFDRFLREPGHEVVGWTEDTAVHLNGLRWSLGRQPWYQRPLWWVLGGAVAATAVGVGLGVGLGINRGAPFDLTVTVTRPSALRY